MSSGAMVHRFLVAVSNVDRHVYETLDLRVARHPSETEPYLAARVLAYALEFQPGLAFTRGLSDPDQPALEVRDATGRLEAWIEIGTPDAARLHRAAKAAPRVAVYTHTDAPRYWASLAGARIHREEALELRAFDRGLVGALAAALERRTAFELSLNDGTLYLTLDGVVHAAALEVHRLG